MNDLLLRACRREPVTRPPVWLMRQAGRYLPQYRAVRARHDFLTMVTTPELAVEVTLQPVSLLGVDAAIIFSDILIIPMAMGMSLTVNEGTGPAFDKPLRAVEQIDRLKPVEPGEDLRYVLEAISLARQELAGRVPLIGFAGGPWTLATYMVEGSGSKEWRQVRRLMAENPSGLERLLDRLSDAVCRTVTAQAKAGAQVIQIFESSASALSPDDFERFALPFLARAAAAAKAAGVPVIVFAPGAGWALELLARASGADVIGIDWQTRASEARKRLCGFDVACQGNFDPAWLYLSPEQIRERAGSMLADFGRQGYIANLGHGVLRDTPVEHVQEFVRTVQQSHLSDPGPKP